MWAVVVEVGAPCGDETTRMTQAVEQVFVQTLVPHMSVEAFDEAILHRLARGDIVPVDLAVFLPF